MSMPLRHVRNAVIGVASAAVLLAGCARPATPGQDPAGAPPVSTSASPPAAASRPVHAHPGMSRHSRASGATSPAPVNPTAAAAADIAGACTALIRVDAIQQPDGGPDGPPPRDAVKQFGIAVLPPLEEAMAKGGDGLAASLGVLRPVAEKAASEGAPIPEDDDVMAAVAGFHAWAHQNCGYQNVDLVAVDYKFEGAPARLKPGPTSIGLVNHSGKGEFHVALVVRAKDSTISTVDQLLALPMQEAEARTDVLGAAGAPPGGSGGLLLDLEPGRYFVVCPVSVGGDENGADTHMMHGMAFAVDVA